MAITVHDVARYILEKVGTTTHMKLQKLVYYSQAWSLVWDEEPLFKDKIEAWANGPVVYSLYDALRGRFKVCADDLAQGNSGTLDPDQNGTVDAVLGYYGSKPSQWLSDLTHMEDPWKDAREGLAPGERGNREITHAALAEYYGGL